MNELDSLALIGYIAGFFGLIAVVASAFVVYRSTTTKATIDAQKDLIDTLTQKVEFLEKEVADLRKEQDVIKTLPLKQLSESLVSIAQDQTEILSILKEK